ncbi:MAG: peptidoglycan DD-metalloendopeptidase family protein [Clostridia bacterium]|nr:peptidoglycan DD-metalloendopeptidase family protein [Clostridia bacterium]
MSEAPRREDQTAVFRRSVLSWILVGGMRVVLFPVTLCYIVLVFLWSMPFRILDMVRRARHPFLCADALTRFVDEKDPAVRFWDLYCCFRNLSLSRTDSFFNAYYVRLVRRAHSGPVRTAPDGIPTHPSGWYREEGSERKLAMLYLKFVSALPKVFTYLPSRIAARLRRFGRAMENSHTAIGGTARFLRRRAAVILPLVLFVAVGFVIGFYVNMEPVFAVRVGGETIGYVESRQELTEAVREVENSVSASLGASFKLPENISFSLSKKVNPTYLSKAELVEALSDYTTDYVRVGYALYVEGRLVAASENEGKLRMLLDAALKRAQDSTKTEDISLLSETRILYQNCPVEAFLSDVELEELLLPGEGEGSTVLKLSAYEQKVLPVAKRLEKGQAYCYTVTYDAATGEKADDLSLIYGHSKVEEAVEDIEFSTTYRESDTLYKGSQYVHQKGVKGQKLITYTVYYNGATEYSREVLSEATLKEPIDQVVLIGTKPLPTFGGEDGGVSSGKIFIPPVYGDISSYFGLRDMNGDGILESGHSGIDIPAPKGTPLYASGAGIVMEAGPTGNSYGTAVKILHENGLTTYYAHMNSVTVKVGQRVSQNQMIGTVGTTGYVTGAHVHFEVRMPGGYQVNPLNYLIGY